MKNRRIFLKMASNSKTLYSFQYLWYLRIEIKALKWVSQSLKSPNLQFVIFKDVPVKKKKKKILEQSLYFKLL